MKTSKFRPIHFTIQIWTDFHKNEAIFFFFSRKKNSKCPIFQNGRFSKSPILKKFSRKFYRFVLGLVGLIDAKDIYVAQPIWSLSDIRTKTGKKCFYCVFWLFLPLCQTASRPYRLSYINALRINHSNMAQ